MDRVKRNIDRIAYEEQHPLADLVVVRRREEANRMESLWSHLKRIGRGGYAEARVLFDKDGLPKIIYPVQLGRKADI